MKNTRIVSFGSYVPPKVVTNKDLEKMLDTTDEWIQQRSGIKERRWVDPSQDTTLTMATKACEDALKKAKLKVDDVDALIFGALISDYIFPGTGCLLQKALGFKANIPAYDIRNQCSGFLYALNMANAFIKAGVYKRVMIVGSEIHSNRLDKTSRGRDVSVLFGDGAGACIVEATDETGIVDIHLASQGEGAEVLCVKEPGSNFQWDKNFTGIDDKNFYPYMEGRLVFKNAVERMCESLMTLLAKNEMQPSQIDYVIAHQANMRINAMVLEQLKIPWEKTHHTIDRYGNTTMATIPLTMGEAVELGKIKRGDTVALVAFGAGFTWGSSILKF